MLVECHHFLLRVRIVTTEERAFDGLYSFLAIVSRLGPIKLNLEKERMEIKGNTAKKNKTMDR